MEQELSLGPKPIIVASLAGGTAPMFADGHIQPASAGADYGNLTPKR